MLMSAGHRLKQQQQMMMMMQGQQQRHMLLAAALVTLLLLPPNAAAQSSAVQAASLSVTAAFPCKSAGSFFDISSLECSACDQAAGYVPAPDQLRCVLCDASSGNDTNFGNGFSMTSAWVPARVAPGGAACQCAASAPPGSVISSVSDNGRALQRCVVCPAGTSADAASGACVPPSGVLGSAARDLAYVLSALNARGAAIPPPTATQAIIQGVLEPSGKQRAYTVAQSLPLATWLGPAARTCMDAGSREGCNALANLCVLQMYSPDAAACQIYDELLSALPGNSTSSGTSTSRRASSGGFASPRPAVLGPLPWLYYLPGSPYTTADDVDLQVSLSASAPPLRFVLSAYDINGTWLGLRNWTLQLQACRGPASEAALWTSFGVDVAVSCAIDVSGLLAQLDVSSNGPRFYDPYLAQASGDLYPLPVHVLNKVDSYARSETSGLPAGHVRRLFFADTLLGTSSATAAAGGGGTTATTTIAGSSSAVAVFAAQLSLLVQIQPNARNRIRPPLLTLRYSALSTNPATPPVPASFAVTYINPPELNSAFWYAWQTVLIVLLLLVGGPCWLRRVVMYMRKRPAADAPLDLELLLYGALEAVDVFSATLVLVLFVVSLYWLILTKLQDDVLLLLPDDQLYNFWVTIVLACVGQSIGLVQTIYRQISIDILFLDWEKPRRILTKGGGREEPGPVSAWRTLLVANEWNELQTARLTSPALTLLTVVFVLQGAGLASAALIHPNTDALPTYTTVASSMLLRFGIAAVWCFILSVGQALAQVLVIQRWGPSGAPLTGFVDLLFLANISAVILDTRHAGYYLHGRNAMPHADASVSELNAALVAEEEGLVGGRGLVTSYAGASSYSGYGQSGACGACCGGGEGGGGLSASALNDSQAFCLQLSPELRRQYEELLLSKVQQAAQEQRASKGVLTTALRGPSRPRRAAVAGCDSFSSLFKVAIDEAERNHATRVLIPSHWQRLLRLPPPQPFGGSSLGGGGGGLFSSSSGGGAPLSSSSSMGGSVSALLTHDLHASWSSVLLYGCELRLAALEGLLFAALFSATGSAPAAGFVVLLLQRGLSEVRGHWGANNLARKTAVDQHFLI